MTEVRIREFHYPEDYPAARLLWENAGPGIQLRRSDDPDEIQKKLQRDPELFLVAETDGKMLGTVVAGFDGRRGMVYHLAVAELSRKQGIGELLMDELERRLKVKGCIRCYLLVTVENECAMRFYEKRGWAHMKNVHT
ncbi:MAG: GNAT family N-acetyltransferase [Chloroflexi bacterium]|nr:GNAT family N-acetyltransferase [Chloroflexota bacterium]